MSDAVAVETPIARRRRAPLLWLIAILAIACAIAGGAYYWHVARYYEATDDAYVAANVVVVTPQVGGTVVAVKVRNTDRVTRGQLLVELDAADTHIALEAAEAELARAVRDVRTLYADNATLAADIVVRQAELARAKAEAAKATDDLETRAALVASGAVGKEELKHAEAALATAQAATGAAQAAIRAAEERLASHRARTDGITLERHPDVQRAAARVRERYLAWARTRILAPIDGDVARRAVQVGQRVQPGSNLLSVVPLSQVWVDANFKELQLRKMRIGQPVRLSADLYGDKVEYRGTLVGFGAGTGSAFALLPAQNASGNWIKIVQRVPVRIDLEPEDLAQNPLLVGLSMQVEVDIHDDAGARLAPAAEHDELKRTDIFDGLSRAADARIEEIMAANLGLSHPGVAAAR